MSRVLIIHARSSDRPTVQHESGKLLSSAGKDTLEVNYRAAILRITIGQYLLQGFRTKLYILALKKRRPVGLLDEFFFDELPCGELVSSVNGPPTGGPSTSWVSTSWPRPIFLHCQIKENDKSVVEQNSNTINTKYVI